MLTAFIYEAVIVFQNNGWCPKKGKIRNFIVSWAPRRAKSSYVSLGLSLRRKNKYMGFEPNLFSICKFYQICCQKTWDWIQIQITGSGFSNRLIRILQKSWVRMHLESGTIHFFLHQVLEPSLGEARSAEYLLCMADEVEGSGRAVHELEQVRRCSAHAAPTVWKGGSGHQRPVTGWRKPTHSGSITDKSGTWS